MSDRVGQQLGNYRLERLLGSGGFAEVYLGKQVYLDSLAAIKLMKTTLSERDRADFRAEARTLVHLIHPHIVRILDFGFEGDTPFLVMDYAPNGTLRQRYQRGEQLPLATVVDYVNQVASALQFAHDQKIIHRDVKPENMLLGRHNEILLSDFGIAVVAQSTRTQFTQETVGTISYMAPEQIQAHPRPASDQYSLGVIVYEWLSGERPFSGTFTEIAVKHMMTPVPPLREKIPSLSPEVEQVILTALAKEPTQRFSSVSAFANALEQASRGMMASFPTMAPTQSAPQPSPKPPMAPTVVATPATPILPLMQANIQTTPSGAQAGSHADATVVDTPGTPFVGPSPARLDANAPAVAVPPRQPQSPATPPPPVPPAPQRQPEPERRGISRRAALIAGVSAVGVVAIGGTALVLATHNNSPATTGGTQTTPSATTHTTATKTATAQVNPNILAQDNFHRPNHALWGTSSDNLLWGGDANALNDFSIANDTGQIQRTAQGTMLYTAVLGTPQHDAEVIVTAMLNSFNPSHIGVLLRWSDDQNYYKAFADGNNLNLLKRVQGHGGLGQKAPFQAQPGTLYTIRFQAIGTTLRAKIWPAGNSEPGGWMVTANDSSFSTGFGGLRPNLAQNVTLTVTSFEERVPTNP